MDTSQGYTHRRLGLSVLVVHFREDSFDRHSWLVSGVDGAGKGSQEPLALLKRSLEERVGPFILRFACQHATAFILQMRHRLVDVVDSKMRQVQDSVLRHEVLHGVTPFAG